MADFPYSKFDRDAMILRDHLALDRTILANERTILAYIRTAFTMFVVGITFIKFFDELVLIMVGALFIPIGLFVFYVGVVRYRKMAHGIHIIK